MTHLSLLDAIAAKCHNPIAVNHALWALVADRREMTIATVESRLVGTFDSFARACDAIVRDCGEMSCADPIAYAGIRIAANDYRTFRIVRDGDSIVVVFRRD